MTFDATHTLFHAPRLAALYAEVLRRHHGPRAVRVGDLERLLPMVWQEFQCAATPSRDRFTHHAFVGHPDGSKGFWSRYAERICEYLELEPSPFAAAELYDRFAHADAWEVYADVPSTLDGLRDRGLRLAVLSNWDERLPDLLERLGLAHRFDAIVYSADCGVEKPHPAIFRTCLDRLGVEAAAAVHVGDSELEDVEGARAVGMAALRIDRRGGARSHLLELLEPFLSSALTMVRSDSRPSSHTDSEGTSASS